MSELVDEWVIKWVSEQVIEWVSRWMSEWAGDWVSEQVNEWVSRWLSEWAGDWVSEQVNECCEWVIKWVIVIVQSMWSDNAQLTHCTSNYSFKKSNLKSIKTINAITSLEIVLFTTPSSIVTNQILQPRGSTGRVLDQTGSVQYISTQKCVYVIISCLTVNKK